MRQFHINFKRRTRWIVGAVMALAIIAGGAIGLAQVLPVNAAQALSFSNADATSEALPKAVGTNEVASIPFYSPTSFSSSNLSISIDPATNYQLIGVGTTAACPDAITSDSTSKLAANGSKFTKDQKSGQLCFSASAAGTYTVTLSQSDAQIVATITVTDPTNDTDNETQTPSTTVSDLTITQTSPTDGSSIKPDDIVSLRIRQGRAVPGNTLTSDTITWTITSTTNGKAEIADNRSSNAAINACANIDWQSVEQWNRGQANAYICFKADRSGTYTINFTSTSNVTGDIDAIGSFTIVVDPQECAVSTEADLRAAAAKVGCDTISIANPIAIIQEATPDATFDLDLSKVVVDGVSDKCDSSRVSPTIVGDYYPCGDTSDFLAVHIVDTTAPEISMFNGDKKDSDKNTPIADGSVINPTPMTGPFICVKEDYLVGLYVKFNGGEEKLVPKTNQGSSTAPQGGCFNVRSVLNNNGSDFVDGTYTFYAKDGTNTSNTITITVDTAVPKIEIDPSEYTMEATKDPDAAKFDFSQIDENITVTDASDTTPPARDCDGWDGSLAKVGDYTCTYAVTDAAGNTATAQVTVHVVDTTAPVIAMYNGDGKNKTAIESGSIINPNSVGGPFICVTEDYLKAFYVKVDGGEAKVVPKSAQGSNTAPQGGCFNVSNVLKNNGDVYIDGTYTFYAVDESGNKSDEITITVDTTPPTITVQTTSVGDADATPPVFSKVSLKITDTDSTNLDYCLLNGAKWSAGASKWGWDLNGATWWLKKGENTVQCFDKAGNSATYTFIYDATAPTATVAYSTTDWTKNSVVATITASEPIANAPDGWTKSDDGTTLTKTFTTNGDENVDLCDAAGNCATVAVSVKNVDKTAPTIGATSASVSDDGNTLTVKSVISDSASGLARYACAIYDASGKQVNKVTYEVSANQNGAICPDQTDISGLPNGNYTVNIWAEDNAGAKNAANSASKTSAAKFTIAREETTPPTDETCANGATNYPDCDNNKTETPGSDNPGDNQTTPTTPTNPGGNSVTPSITPTRAITTGATTGTGATVALTDTDNTDATTDETDDTTIAPINNSITTNNTTNSATDDQGEVLGAQDNKAWALLNLILALLTVVGAIILLLAWLGKDDSDDNRHGVLRVLSLVPAVAAVIAFFLTEDWTLPMKFVDVWTWLMLVIAVVQVVLMVLATRHNQDTRDNKNQTQLSES